MRRFMMIAAMLFVAMQSRADAYVWPLINPELAHWYATYTTVINRELYRLPGATSQASMDELKMILQANPRQHHTVRVAFTGGIEDYRVVYVYNAGEEAFFLIEWTHNLPWTR